MEEIFWASSAYLAEPTEVSISGGTDTTTGTEDTTTGGEDPTNPDDPGITIVVGGSGGNSSDSGSGGDTIGTSINGNASAGIGGTSGGDDNDNSGNDNSTGGKGGSSSSSSGSSSSSSDNDNDRGGNDNGSRGVVKGVSTTNVGSNNTSSGGNDTSSGGNDIDYMSYLNTSRNNSGSSTSSTAAQVVGNQYYLGGNQVIGDYASGQKIIFGATFAGATFDGAGNFIVNSNLGMLAIQNARDKIIDLSDGAGNTFVTAYEATNPGVIDFRLAAGYEIVSGSSMGADVIFAGNGSSQLWGGWDNAADVFVGGYGTDVFMCGRFFGGDAVLNAASNDVVSVIDSTLSDIVATGSDGMGNVAIAFNTGNFITFQSSELVSAAVVFADGAALRYNHVTQSWQGA